MEQQPPFRPIAELRRDWLIAFGTPAPSDLGRELLSRAVSWKEQERLHGGLKAETLRHLKSLAKQLDRSGDALSIKDRWLAPFEDRLNDGRCEITYAQKYAEILPVITKVAGERCHGAFGLFEGLTGLPSFHNQLDQRGVALPLRLLR
jgi:hypothetical protein